MCEGCGPCANAKENSANHSPGNSITDTKSKPTGRQKSPHRSNKDHHHRQRSHRPLWFPRSQNCLILRSRFHAKPGDVVPPVEKLSEFDQLCVSILHSRLSVARSLHTWYERTLLSSRRRVVGSRLVRALRSRGIARAWRGWVENIAEAQGERDEEK